MPTRIAAPPPPSPRLEPEPTLEAKAPAVEKRRILPTLIVPQIPPADPEPVHAAEEPKPKRPRGRPRKQRPAAIEPAAAPVDRPAPVALPPSPVEAPLPVRTVTAARDRKAAPALDLPRAERWKRRLSRWAR